MSIRIQCESCQRAFQVPDSSEGKQTRCPSCQALILIKGPELQVVQAEFVKDSAKNATSQPQNEGILVSCHGCGRNLRAPGKAVGKAIRCPSCQTTIAVPSAEAAQPVRPVRTDIPESNVRSTANSYTPLGDDSLWASIPPATASVPYAGSGGYENPYAASASYGGGSRGSSRASREIQYKIIGILMMIWGGLIVVGCIVRPIVIVVALLNVPNNVVIDYAKLTPYLIGTAIGFVIGLGIAFAMFQGGSSFFNQTDLKKAKTMAIVTAIPCIGTCLFPVGIWACFLVYNERAKRDFDS